MKKPTTPQVPALPGMTPLGIKPTHGFHVFHNATKASFEIHREGCMDVAEKLHSGRWRVIDYGIYQGVNAEAVVEEVKAEEADGWTYEILPCAKAVRS